MRLLDKVVVVTGAASGIGKEIARACRREGAKVVIADLNQAGADAAAAELGGNDAIGVAMDVTNEAEVEAGMAKAVSVFGRIDVLVSNAGIQIVAPLEEFDFAKWKLMLAIHLDGAFLTTRAALKQMYAQEHWRQYHLHGLGAFEGSLAIEGALRDGQARTHRPRQGRCQGRRQARGRANVICPGFVRTPLVDQQIPDQAKALGLTEQQVIKNIMLKDTVDGEFTTVEDVAEAAVFFASFNSNALTGQSLIVSHGWSMQ